MYDTPDDHDKKPCGVIVNQTLLSILKVADGIIAGMEIYNLIARNCQDFCNKFLKCFKLKTFKTTIDKAAKKVAEILVHASIGMVLGLIIPKILKLYDSQNEKYEVLVCLMTGIFAVILGQVIQG